MLSEIQAPLYGKGSLQWTFEPFEPCNAVMSGILTRLTVGGRNFTFAVGKGKSKLKKLDKMEVELVSIP